PSYPWLFEEKETPGRHDVVLNLPGDTSRGPASSIVATEEALALVAYLKSLKQPELPGGIAPAFIPSTRKKKEDAGGETGAVAGLPDGEALYTQTCAACHQAGGQGLPGAFPAL